jgi:hypothetical protein
MKWKSWTSARCVFVDVCLIIWSWWCEEYYTTQESFKEVRLIRLIEYIIETLHMLYSHNLIWKWPFLWTLTLNMKFWILKFLICIMFFYILMHNVYKYEICDLFPLEVILNSYAESYLWYVLCYFKFQCILFSYMNFVILSPKLILDSSH